MATSPGLSVASGAFFSFGCSLESFVDAGLPARAGGAKVLEYLRREAQGDELLGGDLLGAALAGADVDGSRIPEGVDRSAVIRIVGSVFGVVWNWVTGIGRTADIVPVSTADVIVPHIVFAPALRIFGRR